MGLHSSPNILNYYLPCTLWKYLFHLLFCTWRRCNRSAFLSYVDLLVKAGEIKGMEEQLEKCPSLPGDPSSSSPWMVGITPPSLKRATCVLSSCLSPFLETSDVVVIFMLFSPVHILHVLLIFTICFGLHAILLYFLHIPFPGLLLPPQAAGSLQATCCSIETEKVGHPSKNRVERGDQRRHLSCPWEWEVNSYLKISITFSNGKGRVEEQCSGGRKSVAGIRKLPGFQSSGNT